MALKYSFVLPGAGTTENYIAKEMFEDILKYFATVDALYLKLTGGAVTGAVTITTTTATPLALSSNQSQTLLTVDNTAVDGDPVIEWMLSGSAKFIAGVDDSDGDSWVLASGSALGTNNDIRIDGTTGAVAIRGTNTNVSSSAGFVGEIITSIVSTATTMAATNTFGNLTSISLTKGSWLLFSTMWIQDNGTTFNTGAICLGAISINSGNTTTDHVDSSNVMHFGPQVNGVSQMPVSVVAYPLTLAADTTVYLKGKAVYTGTAPQYVGKILGIRIN